MDSVGNILLIEDDQAFCKLYRVALEGKGYRVDEASDGKVGLTKALHGGYDAIILDLMLPVMNGFDVLKVIRETETTKNLPVIVLTNLEGPEVEELRSLGISDSILKAQVTPTEFVQRLDKVLTPVA